MFKNLVKTCCFEIIKTNHFSLNCQNPKNLNVLSILITIFEDFVHKYKDAFPR